MTKAVFLINESAVETPQKTTTHPDATLIATCNKAIALLHRVRAWGNKTEAWPVGDEAWEVAWDEIQAPAWKLTRQAMAMPVCTLAGARAQVELLLMHHECQGNPPEKPSIELPPLVNLMRLLPAA